MLELIDICKVFDKNTVNEKVALDNVSLTLNNGDFVTMVGSNGAGKSTLLNAVAGMFPLDNGSIILNGNEITHLSEHQRAAMIGRVFQDPLTGTAAHMTVEENLVMAWKRGQRRRLRRAIRFQSAPFSGTMAGSAWGWKTTTKVVSLRRAAAGPDPLDGNNEEASAPAAG